MATRTRTPEQPVTFTRGFLVPVVFPTHLRVFGAKCWALIPTVHGAQVTGGSKLDPRAVECRFLGYAGGHGNYKVQEVGSRCIFVSRDVVFEEGEPHRTSPSVGEKDIPLFDALDEGEHHLISDQSTDKGDLVAIPENHVDQQNHDQQNHEDHAESNDQRGDIHAEPIQQTGSNQHLIHRSSRIPQPSSGLLQSKEYQQREEVGRTKGEAWTNIQDRPSGKLVLSQLLDAQDDYIACLAETKASHKIPHSYRHAMSTDPDRWMIPMQVEMDTLITKHTWDLVKAPPGANVMDSMWVYDIKWDGEGNWIKDKARLVGKGYTQQLGIDYNETWAGVT